MTGADVDETRRRVNKGLVYGILTVLTGGAAGTAYVAENEGYTDFVPDEEKNPGGGAGGGSGTPQKGDKPKGPVFLDRNAYQEARNEVMETKGESSIFSDEVYNDFFDGEGRDLVGAYFDTNNSEDKTDSSFKYFFVQNIDDYMMEQNGEEVFDYSQIGDDDLRMDSTSWSNISDSTSEIFEDYGTRNRDKIPDILEGDL